MPRRALLSTVGIAAVLLLLAGAAQASTTTYLTTSLTQAGIKQTVIAGFPGVEVNYTASSAATFTGFVYLSVLNSAGQTVSVSVASCTFTGGTGVVCLAPIQTSVAPGTYSARVFATTNDSVPVSAFSTLQISV